MRLTQLFHRKKKAEPSMHPSAWGNSDWVEALRSTDPTAALEHLRVSLVEGLRIGLRKQGSRVSEADIDDFVQDALVRIMDNLDAFRGESRFLTWSYKIVIRVAFSSLRRKRWQDVSIDALAASDPGIPLLADPSTPADVEASRSMLVDMLNTLMREELTPRQQTALRAVALEGMPLEEVSRQLNTNRNALYKLLHDARIRLKSAMESRNLSLDELIEHDE